MARQLLALRLSALLAVAVLVLAAGPVEAGRGGGGYAGGYRGAYAGGGYRGGYYGGYHAGYYGGYYRGYYGPYRGGFYAYYRGYGWGYGGFGPYAYLPYPYYGFGVGVGLGYPGYLPYGVAGGAYYPPAGVVVAPAASAPPTDPPDQAGPGGPPPGSGGPPQDAQPPKPDGRAHLLLLVPANAEVWFDGRPTSQAGTEREFTSPVLTPDKVYTYAVRVRSRKDGGTLSDDTRPIRVRANDRWLIDFTRPAPRMEEAAPDGPPLERIPPPSR